MASIRDDLDRIAREHRATFRRAIENGESLLAQPFQGVTTDGTSVPGLFGLAPTGISTDPIRAAAERFLASLSEADRQRASFPVETDQWRRWNNTHMTLMRHGIAVAELDETQRAAAFGLLEASLSARGYQVSRDIMKLNQVLGDITGRYDDFTEGLYWLSIMGTPSPSEPWGWQIDGHHLNVNYLVIGDQVVMSPTFMGSEPTYARNGQYAGTRVMREEQQAGLALFRSLNREQQSEAMIVEGLPPELYFGVYRDNVEVAYEGTRVAEFSTPQRDLLMRVIETYVGRLRDGHAALWLAQIEKHLGDTYFGWIGESEDNDHSVFYYRVHSPVILIEFEHPSASPIRPEVADLLPDGDTLGAGRHTQNHVHTMVRTPNGNDYGIDLLRQHHARFDHSTGGHVARG